MVNVRIPNEILKALDAKATAKGIPRHQAIREALAEYVDRNAASAEREPIDVPSANKRLNTCQDAPRCADDQTSETP